ncbi:hypothetical protein L1987_43530 [Smallanthus sonchifolius]|uniref:Uncharacterized protein n=1 Tax=Smallanthus sonchifolius TaxID=185202 RepID=A0ACB9GMK9_9ASTR|nr:hypothetical protein L1987_43530 [Smallanthus sonchifolius]
MGGQSGVIADFSRFEEITLTYNVDLMPNHPQTEDCGDGHGAFKLRGALNAVFSLDEKQATNGVATHSSGNHAAALALAAKLRGIPSYLVLPNNAPQFKMDNVKRYGGNVILCDPNMKSREETARKVLNETGAVLVPSSNDARIISGQGTVALEFLDEVPELDTLIVPISGGGLISGVAIAAKSINPTIRVLGAEPKGADDAAQSKASGSVITLSQTNTIADGLRASLGDLTWPIVRDFVDGIITVSDIEIIQAMRSCYEILKLAVEPSAAVALAAVMSENFKGNPDWKDSRNVGIVLSGGNVDLRYLWESLNKM